MRTGAMENSVSGANWSMMPVSAATCPPALAAFSDSRRDIYLHRHARRGGNEKLCMFQVMLCIHERIFVCHNILLLLASVILRLLILLLPLLPLILLKLQHHQYNTATTTIPTSNNACHHRYYDNFQYYYYHHHHKQLLLLLLHCRYRDY